MCVCHNSITCEFTIDNHYPVAEHVLSPGVYVTLHPHPNVERVCTPAVSCDQRPVWDHHCITHIPNMYLQPQVANSLFVPTLLCVIIH